MRHAAVVALVLFGLVPAARADMIAPNPAKEACWNKVDGDACELDGKAGACAATTCTRRAGGVLNPHEITEPCVLCDPTATPKQVEPPTPTPVNVEPAPAEVDPPTPAPAKVEPAKVEPAKVEPAKVEPAKVEPAKSSFCSVANATTPLASLAIGLVLLVLARPRRR